MNRIDTSVTLTQIFALVFGFLGLGTLAVELRLGSLSSYILLFLRHPPGAHAPGTASLVPLQDNGTKNASPRAKGPSAKYTCWQMCVCFHVLGFASACL